MNRIVKVEVLVIALYGFTVCTVCALTPVDLCDDQEFNQNVTVVGCKEPPCLLRKQTSKKFIINFVPDRDIDEIYNSVHAKIAGLDVPFVGVHGTNACDYIFSTDLEQKVGCPLKKDEPVTFKYQVNVYDIYPNIDTIVHWGLTGSDEKDVMCFEVPVSIVNSQQQ